MPNWCSTDYRCYGNNGELVELKEKLDYLNSLEKPLVENGFGKLWCGCLVSLLGGDWNEVHCRGEIDSYEFSGTTLCISVTSAWGELDEWRKFIKSKYPKLDIFYYAEEIGEGIYVTNDEKGIYFPNRYILDSWKFGIEYFNDLESLVDYIYTLIGVRIKDTSIEGIRNILKKYAKLESLENRKEEDCYYSINEIIVESG